MSGVVLRCPNCGTTKVAPGECDACHEAQVRYYCTNHTPGRWLESPACSQCGARFGEPARRPAVPAPAPATPARRPAPAPVPAPTPVPASAPPPAPRPPYSPTGGIRTGGSERNPRERVPPTAETEVEVDPRDDRRRMRVTTWQDLLRAAARARALPREAPPDPVPSRRGLGGCLMRFVLLMMLLFIAITIAPFLFGSALLQMFGFY